MCSTDSGCRVILAAEKTAIFQIQMAENPKSLLESGAEETAGSPQEEWLDWLVEDTYDDINTAGTHAKNLVQTFGRPTATSDKRSVCRPSLSGTAAAAHKNMEVKCLCRCYGDPKR